jgi:hypothetical protein
VGLMQRCSYLNAAQNDSRNWAHVPRCELRPRCLPFHTSRTRREPRLNW